MIEHFTKIALLSLLLGFAAQADISVTPLEHNLTIAAGDTASVDFEITNTSAVSATTLESMLFGVGGDLQSVLDSLDNNFTAVTDLIPNRFDFSNGVTGTQINDGGGDMYDGGNVVNTNLASSIPYSDGTIIDNAAQLGPNGAYFTRKHPGLFVFAADLDGISNFSITGNLGADGRGTREGAEFDVNVAGTNFKGFFTRVFNAGDPSINHLMIVPNSTTATHSFLSGTSLEDHNINGLQNTNRIYYLLFASASGGRVDDTTAENIMRAFLANLGSQFVSFEDPPPSTLPAGGSQTVTVAVDTLGLDPGAHQAIYDVSSGNTTFGLPINLTVTSAPGLHIGESSIDFGETYNGSSDRTQTVLLTNNGSQTLAISDANTNDTQFSIVSPTSFAFAAGDTHEIEILFAPTSLGTKSATLNFNTNDPTDPTGSVTLSGVSIEQPITVTPAAPSPTMFTGDQLDLVLNLENVSAVDRQWALMLPEKISLEEVLSIIDTSFTEITQLIPDRYDFLGGETGSGINDGQMYTAGTGNLIGTNRTSQVPYSDGTIVDGSNVIGPDARYFTRKRDGLFLFAGDRSTTTLFRTSGGAKSAGGIVDFSEFNIQVGHRNYRGFLKRNYADPDSNTINHLFILPDDPTAARFLFDSVEVTSDLQTIDNLSGDRLYQLLFSTQDGLRIDDNSARGMMQTFIQLLQPPLVQADLTGGILGIGDTLGVNVALDASRLTPGIHTRLLQLDVGSSAGLVPIEVAIEVVAAAGLSMPAGSSIEFGPTYTDLGRERHTFTVTNVGSLPLDISNLSSTEPAFSLEDPANFQIPAGESREIGVVFHPSNAGATSGSITFSTNDPTDPTAAIALVGTGVEPQVSLSAGAPLSILAGDQATFTVTMANQTAGEVDWEIRTGATSLEEALMAIDAHGAEIAALVPERFNFTEGYSGTVITDGGLDMYNSGNRINFGLFFDTANYTNGRVSNLNSNSYFTHKIPGLFTFAGDFDLTNSHLAISGNKGSQAINVESHEFEFQLGHTSYHAFFRRNFGGSTPSTNQLFLVPDPNSELIRTLSLDPTFDNHGLVGIGGGRAYHLLFSTKAGFRVDDATVEQIARAFAGTLNPTWIATDISTGQLAVGESFDVDFQIDTAGLSTGLQQAPFVIDWNIPPPPEPINSSVSIEVLPSPGLQLPTTLVDFGAIELGNTALRSLTIRNIGTEPLDISNLAISGDAVFGTNAAGTFQIPAHSEQVIEIDYAPSTAASHAAQLTFDTNDTTDPTGSIDLTAAAISPALALSPPALEIFLFSGDSEPLTPILQNISAADLDWSVTLAPVGQPDLESTLAAVDADYASVTAQIPDLFEFVGGETGSAINGANSIATNLSGGFTPNVTYSSGLIQDHVAIGSGTYFTRKQPGLFVFASDLGEEVTSLSINGNISHGTGFVEGKTLERQRFGTDYTGFFKTNTGSVTSTAHHLVIFAAPEQLPQRDFSPFNNSDLHSFSGISGGPRVYFLRFETLPNTELSDETAANVMDAFLALLSPRWAQVPPPASGTLTPASSTTVPIIIDAAGLPAGDYSSGLIATWENPTLPGSVTADITLHVVDAPGLDLGDTNTLEFGETFTELGSILLPLPISNTGTEPLMIGNIATSSADFTPSSTTDITIAPGESAELNLVFSPSNFGSTSGSLTFTTNDPTDPFTTVTLNGTGVAAPLRATPRPITQTLVAGDSSEFVLQLENLTSEPLDWSIEADGGASTLEDLLLGLDADVTDITDLIPNRFDFNEGVTGSAIGDGGGDMYDNGNFLNTNLGSSIAYSDGAITTNTAIGAAGRYFTKKQPGLFVFAADLDGVSSFSITGNLGADGAGISEGTEFNITSRGVSYKGFFTRVFSAGDPSINHLVIVPNSPTASHTFLTTTSNENHIVSGLQNTNRIYYLLFSSISGGRIDDPTAESIMQAFIDRLGANFPRIEPPLSGQLPTLGSTTDIPLGFESEGREAGTSQSTIALSWTSSGSTQTIELPVTLEIIDAPNLKLDTAALDFGTNEVGSSSTLSFNITNSGSQALDVASLQLAPPPAPPFTYSLSTAGPFTLQPGASQPIIVTFSPRAAADFPAVINITSNNFSGSLTQLPLSGDALDPPSIGNVSTSINFTAPINSTATGSFSFQNDGDRALEWLIDPGFFPGNFSGSLEDTRDALNANFSTIISKIPQRLDFAGGTFGTSIAGDPDGLFIEGNQITSNGSAPLSYTNGKIVSNGSSAYFTKKYPGLFVFSGNVDPDINIAGTLGRTDGQVDGEQIALNISGIDYIGLVKRVYGSGAPSVNHLTIFPASTSPTHTFSSDPTLDTDTTTTISSGSVHYLLFSTADGSRIDTPAMTEIMRAYLTSISPFDVTLSQFQGTLEPDESVTINISIPTDNRIPTTYETPFFITSNDPNSPLTTIPTTFEILPLDLSLSTNELEVFAIEGDPSSSFLVDVISRDANANNWTAKSTVPWVTIDSVFGTTPSTMQITIDPTAAPPGQPEVGAVEFTSGSETVFLVATSNTLTYDIDRLEADPDRPIVYGFRNGGTFADDAFVFTFDPFTGAELRRLNVGSCIESATIHRDDQKLYIATTASNELQVIDLDSFSLEPPLGLPAIANSISAAGPGRIVADNFPGNLIQIIDTSDGSSIGSASTSLLDPGEGRSANGLYFRTSDVTMEIEQFDLFDPSDITSFKTEPITGSPMDSRLLLSEDAQRVFWQGIVLDQNLNYLGDLGTEIFSSSPVGDLVVTTDAIRKLSAGGTMILDLTSPTEVSAIWGSAQQLVLYNPTSRQIETTTLRDYQFAPANSDFGIVTVTTNQFRSISIENNSTDPVTISSLDFENDAFSVNSPLPLTIAPGLAGNLSIQFSPRHTGDHNSTFTINTSYKDPLPAIGNLTASANEDLTDLPGFEAWRAQYFTPSTDPDAGLLEDPDGDGRNNLTEFLYFLDPINGETPTENSPKIIAREETRAVIRYTRASGLSENFYRHQRSTDLLNWISIPAVDVEVRSNTDKGDGSEQIDVALPHTGESTYFRILSEPPSG